MYKRQGHTRNLTDEMIRTMAERGGVMGINYCPVFLDDREDGGTKMCIRDRHSDAFTDGES